MSDATDVRVKFSADGRNLLDALGKMSGAVNVLSGVLASLGAVFSAGAIVSGFITLEKRAIDTADAMGKMAQKAGQTAEEFSALNYSAKLSDVTQEQLIKTSKSLAEEMVKQGRAGDSLREEYLQLADEMKRLPDGAAKIELAHRRLGKSGQDLIPWLSQGRAAIEAETDEAKDFGLVIGPRFAANADQFNDNLARMKASLEGVSLAIAKETLPGINRVMERMIELAKNSPALSIIGADVVRQIKSGAGVLITVDFMLRSITERKNLFQEWREEIRKLNQREGEDVSQTGGAAAAETEEQRIKRLEEILKNERAAVELQIVQRELLIEQTKLEAQQRGIITDEDVAKIRQANDEIRKLITYKQDLTRQGREGTLQPTEGILPAEGPFGAGEKPFLTSDEALHLQNEDARSRSRTKSTAFQNQFSDTSIFDQLAKSSAELELEWGTVAQNIARTFKATIGSAIDAISRGISGLILGTKTWAQALQQIGTSVLETIIEGTVKMAAQWVLSHVIMKGVAIAFSAVMIALGWSEATAKNAQSASVIPGLAATATLSSISDWGVGAWVGVLLMIAALGVGIAAATGAFAEGGMVRGPGGPKDDSVLAWLSNGEGVLNAAATERIGGAATINALNADDINTLPFTWPAAAGETKVMTHVHFNERAMREMIFNHPDWDHHVMEAWGRNRHFT